MRPPDRDTLAAEYSLTRRVYDEWAARYYKILDKHKHIVPLRLRLCQRRVGAVETRQLRTLGRARYYILKGRQGGITTDQQARSLHTCWRDKGAQCQTAADTGERAEEIFNITRRAIHHFPRALLPARGPARTKEVHFTGLDSRYRVITAGVPEKTAISVTLTRFHGCLAPETEVLLADGEIVPIATVVAGDRVLTHSGDVAVVRGVSTTPARALDSGETTVLLRPWLHRTPPITLTPDHKVWTPTGWRRADALRAGDEVGHPIRPLRPSIEAIAYRAVRHRTDHGGRRLKSGPDIPLTRETGFGFGYYLAEGTVARQSNARKRPCAVVLAHDYAEQSYADRAAQSFAPWVTSAKTRRHRKGRTAVTTLYGVGFAETVAEHFGEGDARRIPSWVWSAPRAFAEGIIAGYWAGDGSKGLQRSQGYADPRIAFTSVRAHLVTQLRDLLASLGIGWGALSMLPTGMRYGRNCRSAWTLTVNGTAALRLRRLVGMPLPDDLDRTARRRAWTEKYRLTETMVWVKLREVGAGPPCSQFHDILLDHPDHSFRTVACLVSNSEFAHWPEPTTALAALTPALEAPGTVIALETTGSGFGSDGYNFWHACEEAGYERIFIPWWECDPELYQTPLLEPDELGALDDEERALREGAAITLEQLKWRRAKIRELTRNEFLRQYAEDDESCWLAVGGMYYDATLLRTLIQRAPVPIEAHMGGERLVYAYALPGERVIIGADTAEGVGGDCSAYVARAFSDWRLLETFASATVTPGDFATMLNERGRAYGEAYLIPEKNFHGITVCRDLRDRLQYPVSAIYHRETLDRAAAEATERIGWATTGESKPLMLAAGHELLTAARDGLAGIPSAAVSKQALAVRRNAKGAYDTHGLDLLVSEMLAWIARSAPMPSEGMYEAMKRRMAAKAAAKQPA